ncbi:uncharacterized protein [Ptychodera flava]|uniref:uncharacterized protein n=1 Tax=Ptychodera flava TaxID=63121 RepID=UPI003969FF01
MKRRVVESSLGYIPTLACLRSHFFFATGLEETDGTVFYPRGLAGYNLACNSENMERGLFFCIVYLVLVVASSACLSRKTWLNRTGRKWPDHGFIQSTIGPIQKDGVLSFGSNGNELSFHITGFNLWQNILNDNAILTLSQCEQNGLGDLFSWLNANLTLAPTLVEKSDVFYEQGLFPLCIGCTRYEIRFQRATYEEAQSTCHSIGEDSKLATIADVQTQEAISSTIYTYCVDALVVRGFWIGLSDSQVQGTYLWDDGTPLSETGYEDWAPFEPNNKYKSSRGHQDCVQMWKRTGFQWDDDWCFKSKGFICQNQFC